MPSITFVESDGQVHKVNAEVGETIMQAAHNASVPGILADCGGSCSCGTCHGYVDVVWFQRLPAAEANEAEMLQCVLEPRENSRLTCQIKVTKDLDGIEIRLPASQV